MRRYLQATCVSAAALAFCGCAPSHPASQPSATAPVLQTTTSVVVQNVHPSPDRPGTVEGDWTADLKDRTPRAPVQLTVIGHEGDAVSTNKYWSSETPIDGLPAGGQAGTVHFGLSRTSGGLTFDGASDGHQGHGVARFEPDAAYAAEIQRLYGQVSSGRLFELGVCGFDVAYGQALYDAGYRFALDEALHLYCSGIPFDFAVDLHKAGYEYSFGDIIHLAHAGITAGFAREIREGGLQLSAEDLILLNHSGVPSDYAIAMRRAGAGSTVGDIIYLQHSEVNANYARTLSAAGCKFNAADLIAEKLSHATVTADYITAMKKAGYALGAEDLIRLRHAGVEPDYAAALATSGHENLNVDDIITLHQRGVDTEMIRKLRK